MTTAAIRHHWSRVAALGCIICGGPACIAHAHGGSVRERTNEPKCKGKKLERLHYLVLPLCPRHHTDGPEGEALDRNVATWEQRHGPQAEHIDRLCELFGIDLWKLARSTRQTVPA